MAKAQHKHVYVTQSVQVVDEGRTIKTVRACSCGATITNMARNPQKDR